MNLYKIIKNPKPYFLVALNRVNNLFKMYFYSGDKVYCEICNWKGKLFFNGKCPKCNSLPRTRLIPFSINYFNLKKLNLKILHIAPNLNEYQYIFRNFKNIDKYDRLNNRNVSHINLVQDITSTTIENDIYDLIIVWHVFEHIKEDVKAMSEVFRILKPSGNVLVSVPIYPIDNEITFEDANINYEDYEKTYGHNDHCRGCGLDYYKRFENFGFKTEVLNIKNIEIEEILKFGLSQGHVVWCFSK